VDKRVVLAVAGSGKTRAIVDELTLGSRVLIITYTNNNYENLKQRVRDKFGLIPENVSIYTYFSFLYTFCYLPCVFPRVGSRNINYNSEHRTFSRPNVGRANPLYYQDYSNNLLGNRLALLINDLALDEVVDRLERFYDSLIIDEVQDFAANDFNFIKALTKTKVRVLYVGDFYQHTYDTSRDGNTGSGLYKNGYESYKYSFGSEVVIDDTALLTSYRCSSTICEYVTNNLGININSNSKRVTSIEIIEDVAKIVEIMENDDIPKLFYQSHSEYACVSTNWGASKGIDKFHDVCVVLNPTTWPMAKSGNFSRINESTKNKLYVAITRARGNLYFIQQSSLGQYKHS